MPHTRPRHRAATGRSSDRSARAANLALMRMMHNYRIHVAPEHGTNQLFHVGRLQATFHLEALARPWRAAFCWLFQCFHCSRRRRVGRGTRGVEELDTATS